MNIKFPKEEIRVVEEIQKVINLNNRTSFLNQYDNVVNNAFFLQQYYPNVLDSYIDKIFEYREFDKLINIVEDLNKKGIENYRWYFYFFSITIANKDFYYAKSVISKSKLLNDNSIKYLIDESEGSYNQIINLHYSLLSTVGLCLIMINFVNELFGESLNKKLDDEYIIMRYFDLMNLLYEYGVDEEFIYVFRSTLETIYEFDVI